MCLHNFLQPVLNEILPVLQSWGVLWKATCLLSDGYTALNQLPKLSSQGHNCFFLNKAAWDEPGLSSLPVLEAQCWEQQKAESQAARQRRRSVAVGSLRPRWQRGKTTQSRQGIAGRESSQSSAQRLRHESLASVTWMLFSRVHISEPIHRKRCKTLRTAPTSTCQGRSCAALNCFYFMCQAWLHQSGGCDAGTFQDRLKTVCSLETGKVPPERVLDPGSADLFPAFVMISAL